MQKLFDHGVRKYVKLCDHDAMATRPNDNAIIQICHSLNQSSKNRIWGLGFYKTDFLKIMKQVGLGFMKITI